MNWLRSIPLFTLAALQANGHPLLERQSTDGAYIVTLKSSLTNEATEGHVSWATELSSNALRRRQENGTSSDFKKYQIPGFNAYSGYFDAAAIGEIEASEEVCSNSAYHKTLLTTSRLQMWSRMSLSSQPSLPHKAMPLGDLDASLPSPSQVSTHISTTPVLEAILMRTSSIPASTSTTKSSAVVPLSARPSYPEPT